MVNNPIIKLGQRTGCNGRTTVERGVLSIDCSECSGRMDLVHHRCFIGVSERMLPGFNGSIVLKGDQHRCYDGSIVEALTAHSHILRDIKGLSECGSGRKLKGIISRMEKEFKKEPVRLIQRKNHYLTGIGRSLRKKDSLESERFLGIVESISKMIRKLDRDIKREE